MRFRGLLVVMGLVVTAVASGAGAHTTSNSDPNDTNSPFDIRTAALKHNAEDLIGKAITDETFAKSELIPKGNTFYLDLDVDSDPNLDFYVSMFAKDDGELIAKIYRRQSGVDPFRGRAKLTKGSADGGTLLTVVIDRSLVNATQAGRVIRYRWLSQYDNNTWDDAPNSGWYKLTI